MAGVVLKTYLLIWFSSEGAKPSEVTHALMALGFKPVQGQYDFVFEWKKSATIDELLRFGDVVQFSLSGCKVLFKLETVDSNE